MVFSDHVLAKVEMFHTFGCTGCRPLNTCGIIVVFGGSGCSIEHTKVDGAKFDRGNLFDAFIGGKNFSLA